MSVKVGGIEFSEQEVSDFREVFELVDKDKGGTIEAVEVMELMVMLGIKTSREQVESLINDIDEDGNGEIDFEEFLQVMAAGKGLPYTRSSMTKFFKEFSRNEVPRPPDGWISAKELRNAMRCSEYDLSDEEVERLIKMMEPNKNGMINYEEKIKLYLNE
uniref:Calmodulin-like protein n=1 Tax=Tetraselmis sp. GSL018 TaxID=582737 RepID=A0A061RHW7_9CHLO|eukprot:CAMPEP_0177585150 /NCGR_PEP_ID=MMETSP0419_2-20121207/4310_1 /TAXON_ID=582737 /ORGANISM="Tetraselmis sp., Strain GSL018" /LENGTH=159 /DNA_ID=CAMNT_0019074805 /DNA_START=229 /DNA_END=708 /DNA_ORIENTATION=+